MSGGSGQGHVPELALTPQLSLFHPPPLTPTDFPPPPPQNPHGPPRPGQGLSASGSLIIVKTIIKQRKEEEIKKRKKYIHSHLGRKHLLI